MCLMCTNTFASKIFYKIKYADGGCLKKILITCLKLLLLRNFHFSEILWKSAEISAPSIFQLSSICFNLVKTKNCFWTTKSLKFTQKNLFADTWSIEKDMRYSTVWWQNSLYTFVFCSTNRFKMFSKPNFFEKVN